MDRVSRVEQRLPIKWVFSDLYIKSIVTIALIILVFISMSIVLVHNSPLINWSRRGKREKQSTLFPNKGNSNQSRMYRASWAQAHVPRSKGA